MINAVKDVAAALANLIQATKNASGKSFNDPAMIYLKDAAKVKKNFFFVSAFNPFFLTTQQKNFDSFQYQNNRDYFGD